MISNKLVQQVIYALIVVVAICIRIESHPVYVVVYVINRDFLNWLANLPRPKFVCFCKNGVAKITMFRRIEVHLSFRTIMHNLWNLLCLILVLIDVILNSVKSIHQATGTYKFSHHHIAALIRFYHILQ